MPDMNFRERAKSQPAERQIQSLEKSEKPKGGPSYEDLLGKWHAEREAKALERANGARERANSAPAALEGAKAVSKPAHERGDPNAATLSKSDPLKKEIDPSDARNKKEIDPSDARNKKEIDPLSARSKKEIDPASKALEPKKSRTRKALETSRGGFVAAKFLLKTAVKTVLKTALITAPKIAGIAILAAASLLAYVVGKFMGDTSLGDAGWDKAMNFSKKYRNAVGSYFDPRKKAASLRKDAANLGKEVVEQYAKGKVTPLITRPQWMKRLTKR